MSEPLSNLAADDGSMLCPSCGQWTFWLDENSGFCGGCAELDPFCTQCGRKYEPDAFTKDICIDCKKKNWLIKNADAIEAYMMQGLSFSRAQQEVYKDNRPDCLCCGQPMKGAKNGALFCSKTPQCIRARRRFRTLYERHGREVAIIQIRMELHNLKVIK